MDKDATNFRHDISTICKTIEDLLVIKNKKYGNSFDSTRYKYGALSYILRLEDKLNRVYTLTKTNDKGTVDESIEDTLMDIIGYTILELIYRKNDKSDLNSNMLKERNDVFCDYLFYS